MPYEQYDESGKIQETHEFSGYGVQILWNGKVILAGKKKLLEKHSISVPPVFNEATSVFIACDGVYAGYISLNDVVKPDAKQAMNALRKLGVHHLTMLSGDRQDIARRIGEEVGVDQAYGELLPEDKVNHVLALKKESTGALLYAGDGINDAPVLAAADVGIAMGGLGSDAAMEAADVVIMSDEPSKIALAIRIARKTMKIAKENIVFSISIKIIILLLSLFLNLGLWLAVFADVGVCMLAILNTLRIRRLS